MKGLITLFTILMVLPCFAQTIVDDEGNIGHLVITDSMFTLHIVDEVIKLPVIPMTPNSKSVTWFSNDEADLLIVTQKNNKTYSILDPEFDFIWTYTLGGQQHRKRVYFWLVEF